MLAARHDDDDDGCILLNWFQTIIICLDASNDIHPECGLKLLSLLLLEYKVGSSYLMLRFLRIQG